MLDNGTFKLSLGGGRVSVAGDVVLDDALQLGTESQDLVLHGLSLDDWEVLNHLHN